MVDLTKKKGGDEVWVNVVSKSTGKEYPNIQRCNDLQKLPDELSALLGEKIDEAMEKGALTEKDFKDYMKGFVYKHDDGWEYQVVDKGETYSVTRKKPFASGGGFKKGGSYAHFRTEMVKVGPINAVSTLISNQGPTDNYKVTYLYNDAKKGEVFLIENLKQYTPSPPAITTATTEKKEEESEENNE